MNAIITTHNLDFEIGPIKYDYQTFKVGTCYGQWGFTENCFYILSILNEQPGNGHLNDVFEWFEYSAKRDKKALVVREVFNVGFYKHLIEKRGFNPINRALKNTVIKFFGNEIIYR